jgi:hypothetical protein
MDPKNTDPKMRVFAGGATRDTDQNKLDYAKGLSPIVLKRYMEYLAKHRKTAEGLRAFDNWKNGIPQDTYLSSDLRHMIDVWLAAQGFQSEQDIEDSLCATIFNSTGMLHELLKKRGYLICCDIVPVHTCGECADHRIHRKHSSSAGYCSCPVSDKADPGCFKLLSRAK